MLDLTAPCRNIGPVPVLFTIENQIRYDIVRKIFEGGMGIVYEAEQRGARDFIKRVAIKVIRKNFASQGQFIENFIGEAKLVADLIHTNIVQTYHLGEYSGSFFIAMELIRGVNLEQFCSQLKDKRRVLPMEIAVFIASRVARGLAYAHAKTDKFGRPLGLVHRDVSFKNIMVAFEGDVKLTDFGIAKARGLLSANEGEVVAGKADFMSPEQADFQVTDKRSDLFSLGVVLSTLVLGYNIFKDVTPDKSRQRIISMPVPDFRTLDKRVDDKLNQILQRALARKLAMRYPDADEMLYELEHYIYHSGYGPTNETLGKLMRSMFGVRQGSSTEIASKGGTKVLEHTARVATRADSATQKTSRSARTSATTRRTGATARSAAKKSP